ncbi:uncharacterized protein KQ657_005034 [Scheffersomyces spartinae]|uniref:Uncharacterized protein n=1 Tax=Scheffersomyces spartinae TaxID=45513 RepID=A0A9P7VA44_9ASCO|nr:uncharacterized protein KQ657_005034 [Scheffersomyces spartinae]KAG7193836.1 hypothetical protein KQ657_005034 [Scheffersomyces spartinae]
MISTELIFLVFEMPDKPPKDIPPKPFPHDVNVIAVETLKPDTPGEVVSRECTPGSMTHGHKAYSPRTEHENSMIVLSRQMQMMQIAMQEQRNKIADQDILLSKLQLQYENKQDSGSKHKFTSEKSPIPVVEEVMKGDRVTDFAESNTKGAIDPQSQTIGKLSGQEMFDQLNYNEKKEAELLARPIIDQSIRSFESFPRYLSDYSIKKKYIEYFEDFEATNNGFSLLLRSDEMKFDYNRISNAKVC